MKNDGPKSLKTHQKAIILRTFGVRVGFKVGLGFLTLSCPNSGFDLHRVKAYPSNPQAGPHMGLPP